MNSEQTALQGPRWLIIEDQDQRKIFIFHPDEERTIVVGGGEDAHFRIRDNSPLCFYVERFTNELRLVPGYARHLRVNSHRILDPVRLPRSAIVEFGEHRLYLVVQDVPPAQEEERLFRPVLPATPQPLEPHEDQPTRLANVEFTGPFDMPTKAVEAPNLERTARADTSPNDLVQPAAPPVAFSSNRAIDDDPAPATQIMGSIPDFQDSYPGYQPEPFPPAKQEITTSASRHDAESQPPLKKLSPPHPEGTTPASNPFEPNTDRTEGIPFGDFVAPSGKSQAVNLNELSPPPPKKQDSAPPIASPVSGKKREEPSSFSKRMSLGKAPRIFLEHLGGWAKERPVLALGGGAAAALILGLAVGGVSHALSDPSQPKTENSGEQPPDSNKTPLSEPTQRQASEVDHGTVHVDEQRPASGSEPLKRPETASPDKPSEAMTNAERETEVKAAEARAAEEQAHAADINRAVEHLIAGRDDEAAHAYQSLAQTKHATEELKRMSELLERRRTLSQNKPGQGEAPDLYR